MLLNKNLSTCDKSQPHYEQVYEYYKQEIINGRLVEHSKLPSVRQLADFLGLSTTPVEMAYIQLIDEGFITSKPKSGYFVLQLSTPFSTGSVKQNEASRQLQRSKTYKYDFHMSKNDYSFFPYREWKKVYNESLHLDYSDLLFYGDPQGELGLRNEIAKYVGKYRGVDCTPNQIIIGSDQHQLFSILAEMLAKQHSHIAVEDPSYPLIPESFRSFGYLVSGIPLDSDGISIKSLQKSNARIVCVSPSHQFPRGMIMPISKRMKLLEWASEVDGFIIEDDYDGEFRYHGKPIPSLQGIQGGERVIYAGTFSQILAPAISVYYLIIPNQLINIYHNLTYDKMVEQGVSRLTQKALELFMNKGYLEKYIRKMRNVYRRKHDRIIGAINQFFGSKAIITGVDSGFHLLIKVKTSHSEEKLMQLAEKSGFRISSSSFTWSNKNLYPGKEFIVGFAGIEEDKIDEAIELLAELWLS